MKLLTMYMKLLSLAIANFKGIREKEITFGDLMEIRGMNASGKTTIFDALTWLLFDRDSLGNNKFEIRTLDTDGCKIHNVDISVAGKFLIDGREVEIKKTQKENWVKKRGSDVAELQGNKNEYEIDGFPKSQKDYQAFISGIVDDDLFKMLTNPMYFPNMKWQEQRKILMRLLPEISDSDIAEENGCEAIIPDLEKADIDTIKAKYAKGLKELKKRQAELPVRIDEIAKQKIDIDLKELKSLETELEKLKGERAKQYVELTGIDQRNADMQSKLMELQFQLTEIETKLSAGNVQKRSELRKEIEELSLANQSLNSKSNNAQFDNQMCNTWIADRTKEGKQINEEYKAVKSNAFPKDAACPTCGQPLPESEIESRKQKFEADKEAKLSKYVRRANELKISIKELKDRIQKNNSDIKLHQAQLSTNNKKIVKYEAELKATPLEVDMSGDKGYQDAQKAIEDTKKALADIPATDEIKAEIERLDIQIDNRNERINEINNAKSNNGRIIVRINELQEEQKEVSQSCADAEKMIYLLERFVKAKMERVSELINEKFEGLKWKLFENQINGGLKETCELTVDGVPYGSLNNGHRIVSGLQIIKTLQKVFGVTVPIFIDNAESVNDFNLPKMDCQIVKLIVTDDKELVIREVEK